MKKIKETVKAFLAIPYIKYIVVYPKDQIEE